MKYSFTKLLWLVMGIFVCNAYGASTDASGGLTADTVTLTPNYGTVYIPQNNVINLPPQNLNLTAPPIVIPQSWMPNIYLTNPNAPPPAATPAAPPAVPGNDSTSFNPLTNLIINIPAETTVTSDPTNTLYNNFIPCPSIPICPNINDKYSTSDTQLQSPVTTSIWNLSAKNFETRVVDNSSTWISTLQSTYDGAQNPNVRVYCPDQCTSTRQVTPAPPAQPSTYTRAVCPSGYTEVGAFNMQPEIAYDPVGNVAEPYPMDQATYNAYANAGQRCEASNIAANSETYCAVSYSGRISGTYWASMVDLTSFRGNYIGVHYFGNGPLGPGMVVNKGIGSRKPDCKANYLPHDCSHGSLTGCSLSCSNDNTMSYACGNNSGATFQGLFYFDTYYSVCYTKAGLYYTKNMQPASLVCARIKPTWEKQSQSTAMPAGGLIGTSVPLTITGTGLIVSPSGGISVGPAGTAGSGSITSGTLTTGTYGSSTTPLSVTGNVGGSPTTVGNTVTVIPPGGSTTQQNPYAQSPLQTFFNLGSP